MKMCFYTMKRLLRDGAWWDVKRTGAGAPGERTLPGVDIGQHGSAHMLV